MKWELDMNLIQELDQAEDPLRAGNTAVCDWAINNVEHRLQNVDGKDSVPHLLHCCFLQPHCYTRVPLIQTQVLSFTAADLYSSSFQSKPSSVDMFLNLLPALSMEDKGFCKHYGP